MESKAIKILAIDDNSDNLISLKALVKDLFPSAITLTALNGKEGIKLAIKENPEMVLLDIIMPEMDGFKVCEELKQNPDTKDIPVIFITAMKGDKENRLHALEVGAEGFISKPIDETELTAQICAMVKIKNANIQKRNEKERLTELVAERTLELEKELNERKIAETALLESEEKFRNIFERSQVGKSITTLDGKMQVNKALTQILGYSEIELAKTKWQDITHPDSIENDQSIINTILSGKAKTARWQKRYIHKNGQIVFADISTTLQSDKSNKAQYFITSIIDVTEQKKAEAKMQKISQHYQALIEKAPDGIALIDPTGNFAYISPAAMKIFGYDVASEVTGTPPEYTHPEDLPMVLSVLSGIIKDPSIIPTIQYRFICKNGDWKWIESTFTNLLENPSVEAVVINFRDITERKLAEDEIKKLNRLYSLLSNVNQAIVRAKDENILFNNICKIATTYGKFLMTWIGKCNYEKNGIEILASYGKSGNYLNKIEINLNNEHQKNGPSGLALTSGKPAYSNNIAIDEQMSPWRDDALNNGYRSSISLPIIVFGEIYAIVNLYSGEVDFFTQKEIELLEEMAKDIAYSVEFIKNENIRQQMEEALLQSEEKHRLLIENSHDIIYLMNEEGKFDFVSPSWTAILGHPTDFVIGKSFQEFIHPDDIALCMHWVQTIFSFGEKIEGIEYRVKHIDNTYRWHVSSGVPIKNKAGNVTGFEGIAKDITQRKQADEALLVSEERFSKSFHSNPAAMIISRINDGIILDINKSYEQILGYSRNEIIGKSGTELNLYQNSTDRPGIIEKLLQSENPVATEIDIKSKTGKIISVILSCEKIKLESQDCVLATFIDNTKRKIAEQELRESEGRYRAISEYSNNAICIINENAKIEWVNSQMMAISGYTAEQIMGAESFINLLAPESIDFTVSNFKKMLAGLEYEHHYEFYFIHANGEKRLCEKYMMHYIDKHGKIKLILNMLDITEHKRAETLLKASEEKYRNLAETTNDLIWETNLEGKFTYVNSRAETVLGYTKEEMIGKSPFDFMKPDDAVKMKKISDEIVASKKPFSGLENTCVHKNGKLVFIETGGVPIFDNNNIMQGYLGIDRDITERKLSEKEIIKAKEKAEESETRFKALHNASFGGIAIHDKGIIYDCNQGLSIISGYTNEELIGMDGLLLIAEEFRDIVMANILLGYEKPYEVFGLRKNGDKYPLLLEGRNIPYKGKTARTVEFRDITEQKNTEKEIIKAKEKAEESDRLKSAFLANMSHEIRTPMNGILGFAGLLKEPGLTGEKQVEYINIIEKSGARMLNIINDIVDISKIESGQMDIFISETNISEQLDYIFTFFKPQTDSKNLQLSINNKLKPIDNIIKTDKEKTYAVLVNLIKNAIKFTNSGLIEIGCKKENNCIEFYVQDTGTGIKPEHLDIIFERFRQGSELLTRNYEGAGLGLSISKAYVEMLGGKIWAESNSDSTIAETGSRFIFTIPVNAEINAKIGIPSNTLINHEIKPLNIKLLIADDDETSSLLINKIVYPICKKILFAKNGLEALDICRNNTDIDIVLMDVKMPVMDGLEATRKIREFNNEIIIIAQTAYAMTGDRENAINAGCNAYISKPIRKEALLEMIEMQFLSYSSNKKQQKQDTKSIL